jgi:ABC-2 type transport system permease protein
VRAAVPEGRALGRIRTEAWALLAIAQRDLVKLLRDRVRLGVSLAFPILIIAGLGTMLEPTVGRVTGLDAVTLTFTGVLPATLFQSAAAGMMSIVEDRATDFSRELFVAPVSRLTIVTGKVIGESLVALCQGVGIVAFATVFGVRMSPEQLVALIPPSVATCLFGAAFGLATLAALPNQRTAQQVFPFIVLPQYFLAGVVVPLTGLPGYIDAVSRIMPMRYPVDLTRAAFYAGTRGYGQAVTEGPVVDLIVMTVLFFLLIIAGGLVFDYRERTQ